MTSKIKVDNITNQSDSNIINKCGTNITLGQNADTVIIPNGVTEQVQSGGAIQVQSGGSVTIASGATITNSGTATGFGATGAVNWETTPQTGSFQAAEGKGYFMNTTSGALTVTTPATPSAGDIFAIADYARTFATYHLTIAPHAGAKIGGVAENATLDKSGQAATFVYIDTTQGWINVQNAEDTEVGRPPYIDASVSGTGNTLATAPDCANMKIATFINPGTFCVSSAAVCAADNLVSYLVVGSGAAGGGTGNTTHVGGGGGAGGFRELSSPTAPYTASPLDGYPNAPNRITVSANPYTITVGGGGTSPGSGPVRGGNGNVSTFACITSAGGGGGGALGSGPAPSCRSGGAGGSGGGGSSQTAGPGGSGNTPPTTPSQGFPGAQGTDSPPDLRGGGGGGATVAGTQGSPVANPVGVGGAGATTSITGSAVAYAGGGGSGAPAGGGPGTGGAGGTGGGGAGAPGPAAVGGTPGSNGTDNTGGGAGGAGGDGSGPSDKLGGAGGSGIVVIRYRFQ